MYMRSSIQSISSWGRKIQSKYVSLRKHGNFNSVCYVICPNLMFYIKGLLSKNLNIILI